MPSANPKPLASLSLDLDNEWSYLKTHGDPAWETYPSYLGLVVPRVLEFLAARGQRITIFIVGRDAAAEGDRATLRSIADAGHEIGNHSFNHEPWLHAYSADEIAAEIGMAHDAIASATGRAPIGFRGPGFSVSQGTLETLARLGYRYDASTLPTYIGPLARAYYFMTSRLSKEEREQRKALFGGISDGLRPIRPYRWELGTSSLIEIPVTTFPILKTPFHFSYILYMATRLGRPAAMAYFRAAIGACRALRVEPSLLLHPLDFLGHEDVSSLAFFPAMGVSAGEKLALLGEALQYLSASFEVVPMRDHATAIDRRGLRGAVAPRFS